MLYYKLYLLYYMAFKTSETKEAKEEASEVVVEQSNNALQVMAKVAIRKWYRRPELWIGLFTALASVIGVVLQLT